MLGPQLGKEGIQRVTGDSLRQQGLQRDVAISVENMPAGALTGAGATIACGSQPCSGTSAALTPRPAISSTKMAISAGCRVSTSPATKP